MKLCTVSFGFFALASTAVACVHSTGGAANPDAFTNNVAVYDVSLVDNGVQVCSSDMGISTDTDPETGVARWQFGCIPGHAFALHKGNPGAAAWYSVNRNGGVASFKWQQDNHKTTVDCGGECGAAPEEGICLHCSQWSWDVTNYC